MLTNCFASFTFDEVQQRYDQLKQTSGQTPEAYVAQWEEYFLRIYSGNFATASNIYNALGNKQESDVKTKAFGGLYKLARGMANPTAADQFIQQVASFTQMQNFDRQSVISAMTTAVRLQQLEVTRMGRTSKANAKGLQMTPGDNFAEIWGLNNVEVASGGPERDLEAEISAVQLGDRDIIKVPGYTVYLVRKPQKGQPPVYFTSDDQGACSWFCQVCGWGEHHYTQCSNTMDRKGETFAPFDRIKRKKETDAKRAARKKEKESGN